MRLWKTLPTIWKLTYSGNIVKMRELLSELLTESEIEEVLLGKLFLDSNGLRINSKFIKNSWIEQFEKIRISEIYKHKDTNEEGYLESCQRTNRLTEYQKFLIDNYGTDFYKNSLKEDFIKYMLLTSETCKDKWFHGVIVRDGTIYICGDRGHNNLYDKLQLIGESVDDWTKDDKNLKFTYLDFMGDLVSNMSSIVDFGIEDDFVKDRIRPTEEQLNSVMQYKNHFRGIYGELRNNSIVDLIRQYTIEIENYGSKYGNLKFLQKYYLKNKDLKFKLPKFSKLENTLQFKNSFLRTSPKNSIPGLLNSKKVNSKNFQEIVKSMNDEFLKIDSKEKKNRFDRNSFSIFEQEFVSGFTGVASYINDEFSFAISDKENDVVLGIVKNLEISEIVKTNLENVCKTLSKDLIQNVQIEFVIKNNSLYIVQLRILKNLFKKNWNKEYLESEIVYSGKSFCTGYIEYGKWDNLSLEVKKEDILIVSDDCDSKLLTENIQLVLVENDIQFSHILALTSVKKIKSIFGIGKIDIQKIPEIVKIDSMGKNGYVLKF